MTKTKFKLSKYIIPSIISMVVVGTNANIDGFFIGKILGDDGLAAINIAWPIVSLIVALGTGIGIGGSVLINRTRGEGDPEKAERIKNTALFLLTFVGLAVGAAAYAFAGPLLSLMGAEGKVFTYAHQYAVVISAGAVFQVVAAGLLVLLRNDEKTYTGMVYSLVGLGLHLLLNFVLAEKMVMHGVAAATVLSQGVIALAGLISLKPKRAYKPSVRFVPQMLAGSAAPFGINFVPSMVLIFTNTAALENGGVAAVSAYAAMSYAVYTFDYIFQGVCDGIQPIISYCRGSDDREQEKRALKCAGITLAVFAGAFILLTPLLIKLLPQLLGVSGEAEKMIVGGFWIYAASYPFKAAVKFLCSYYYAAGKQLLSNILVYLDPIVFSPLTLILLTKLCGTSGVWLSLPVSQLLLCISGGIILAVTAKKKKVEVGKL